MSENDESGYVQMHLRVPLWLLKRIYARAGAMGQTASAEVRRALVKEFGGKQASDSSGGEGASRGQ